MKKKIKDLTDIEMDDVCWKQKTCKDCPLIIQKIDSDSIDYICFAGVKNMVEKLNQEIEVDYEEED